MNLKHSLTTGKKERHVHFTPVKTVYDYNPFEDNDVLSARVTENVVVLLLKNGSVLTWGNSQGGDNCLGRKEIVGESFIPRPVAFENKIVQIACGSRHCLARSVNLRVYSWGNNSNGQLGRPFEGINNQKNTPTEIDSFINIPIKQVFANGNTSFAITEGANRVYGWGSNDNSQLGFNSETNPNVYTPRVIDVVEAKNLEMTIVQNQKGDKTYVVELLQPSSNLARALVTFKNKHLFYQEYELKEEQERYNASERDEQKRLISLSKPLVIDNQMLNNIQSLANKYQEKITKLMIRPNKDEAEKNNAAEASKSPAKKPEKPAVILTEKQQQLTTENKPKTLYVDNVLKLVSHELQQHKAVSLTSHLLQQEEAKQKEIKLKLYRENKKVFEEIKIELMKRRKTETNTEVDKKKKKETDIAIKKIEGELQAFDLNRLKNIEDILAENDSLGESLSKSTDLLNESEIKISNYKASEKDKISEHGFKIIEIYEKNLNYAKQNNNLVERIIEYSKLLYTSSLESLIKQENPPGLEESRLKNEEYKKRCMKVLSSDEESGDESDGD